MQEWLVSCGVRGTECMAVPMGHWSCGSVGCGVAPAETGEQAKEELTFGAWGSEWLMRKGKRQPAKNKSPSLGHAELCRCHAIPWSLGMKEEWLKTRRWWGYGGFSSADTFLMSGFGASCWPRQQVSSASFIGTDWRHLHLGTAEHFTRNLMIIVLVTVSSDTTPRPG